MSAEQDAFDLVLMTWAGTPVPVIRGHIEEAWRGVSDVPLSEATLSAWSEQMGAGLRVVLGHDGEAER